MEIMEIVRELRDDKDSCGGLLFDYRLNVKSKVLQIVTSENHLLGLFEDGIVRSWYSMHLI